MEYVMENQTTLGHWESVPQNGNAAIFDYIQVQIPANTGIFVTGENKEAMAKAISAVPDIIHACNNALEQLEIGLIGDSGTANILRKALTKALGA